MQEILKMITTLLNNGYVILFFFSCVYTLRQLGLFLLSLKQGKEFVKTSNELLYLGVSIAIIFTIIFFGTKIF